MDENDCVDEMRPFCDIHNREMPERTSLECFCGRKVTAYVCSIENKYPHVKLNSEVDLGIELI